MVLGPSCAPAVVLIVEDEMMLRMRAVDMVEDAGYTPIEALDADEAVAILESRSDIALICTDIQMPGSMDGLGLAHAVHKRWPSDQDHRGVGAIEPAEQRSSSLQQVFRQAT
jgi:CheY-like chemotaxis protein